MVRFSIPGIEKKIEVYQIFYLILAFLGIYLLYSVWKMKKSSDISSIIIPQEALAKCKDKEGFIGGISKSVLLLGSVSLVYGIMGTVNVFTQIFGWGYELLGAAVFLGSCGWYTKELNKCIGKFCR